MLCRGLSCMPPMRRGSSKILRQPSPSSRPAPLSILVVLLFVGRTATFSVSFYRFVPSVSLLLECRSSASTLTQLLPRIPSCEPAPGGLFVYGTLPIEFTLSAFSPKFAPTALSSNFKESMTALTFYTSHGTTPAKATPPNATGPSGNV